MRNSMIALLYTCISVLTFTLPPLYENPIPLEWPFADGIARSMPIGYGDWCPGSEGPHPGIDFSATDGDYLRSPQCCPKQFKIPLRRVTG